MATTAVEVVGDDTVVVKRVPAAAVDVLRREGERLRHAEHPGVVSIVRDGPTADGWELVTAYAGRSLATLERLPVAEVAGIVAGLASTTADLHEIGIVHGRIDPSHVLVGDAGSPRLCGFGDGTTPARPEDDVAALGALLELLLGVDDEPEPIPDRRWGPRRRWRGWERRALLLLADQATAEDAAQRPTARRLAAGIAAAVPAAEPARSGPGEDAVEPSERRHLAAGPPVPSARRGLPLLLAMAGVVLAVAAVARLWSSERGDPAAPVGGSVTDVQVAATVPGSLVVDGGRRYRVGEDGDHLLVGDWWCDGRPTPAVFRPTTHEVFVFERWSASEPLAVPPSATVVGAVEMVADRGSDGCPNLSVRTEDGSLVAVPLDEVR
ncbi:MAG: hypothetical protein ACJ739_05105 [Acidimicrobiales bacterium]